MIVLGLRKVYHGGVRMNLKKAMRKEVESQLNGYTTTINLAYHAIAAKMGVLGGK